MIETHLLPWREADFSIDEEEIVAIGDVHGEADLLEALLDAIGRAASPAARLVFLGDLVDRGPASRACLALAAACADSRPTTWLMGNHEAMWLAWLRAFDDVSEAELRRWGRTWLANGGDRVLAEYGLDPRAAPADLLAQASEAERRVLGELRICHRSGETIFVHAGLAPACLAPSTAGFRLDETEFARYCAQHPLDADAAQRHPLWIREEFLRFYAAIESGPVVVHGHTPAPTDARMTGFTYCSSPDLRLRGRRLALDAGSGRTGEIAAAVIRNGVYRIVYVARK
jgi:serine/threonine protein phosphatase 1